MEPLVDDRGAHLRCVPLPGAGKGAAAHKNGAAADGREGQHPVLAAGALPFAVFEDERPQVVVQIQIQVDQLVPQRTSTAIGELREAEPALGRVQALGGFVQRPADGIANVRVLYVEARPARFEPLTDGGVRAGCLPRCFAGAGTDSSRAPARVTMAKVERRRRPGGMPPTLRRRL